MATRHKFRKVYPEEFNSVDDIMVPFKVRSYLIKIFQINPINESLKFGGAVVLVDSFVILTCTKTTLIKVIPLLV